MAVMFDIQIIAAIYFVTILNSKLIFTHNHSQFWTPVEKKVKHGISLNCAVPLLEITVLEHLNTQIKIYLSVRCLQKIIFFL